MALEQGSVFAKKYRVVRLIDEGGMGAVYEVEQVKVGRRAALKTMHRELVANPDHRKRFEQEARVSAAIASDYIVKAYDHDVDEASGVPWIEMELLHGENLARMVARRGPLSPGEVLGVFEHVAKGLGPAHAAGIIHLDLKPENLFAARFQDRVVVKVLDFGISKIAAEQRRSAQMTSLFASPMFLAPEQARKGGRVTAATDVWALGLIAFFLLTGRYYWRAANVSPGEVFDQGALFELLHEIGTSALDPPSARARSLGFMGPLPPGVDGWFARCVARDLVGRYADATAAIGALASALQSAGPTVVPEPNVSNGHAPPEVPPTRPTPDASAATGPLPASPQTGVASLPVPHGIAASAPLSLGRKRLAMVVGVLIALSIAAAMPFVVSASLRGRTSHRSPAPADAATTPATAPREVPRPAPLPPALRVAQTEPNRFVPLPEGGLAVQEHEVTRGEFAAWSTRRPSDASTPTGDPELPVVNVTRAEAAAYCAAHGGRLPTRAEWVRSLGRDVAWTRRVFPANDLLRGGAGEDERSVGATGVLYDLVANVNEWTSEGSESTPLAMGAFFGERRADVPAYLSEGSVEASATAHTGFRCIQER